MKACECRCRGDGGFTLVEAVISLAILATVLAGLAPLLTRSAQQVHGARRRSMAVWLAESKLAQLRSLTWSVRYVDDVAVWQQDEVSDVSVEPVGGGGGGTRASPGGVMETAIRGYVDYLDRDGKWIDPGALAAGAPEGAAYERRWSIVRAGSDASELVVFHVAVGAIAELRGGGGGGGGASLDWRVDPAVVWVSGAKLRRAR